jgi:hypothetical protein
MTAFDSKEHFEQIEKELETRLAARGYEKTKHDYQPHNFGNMFTVFTSRSGHVRFTWDGNKRWFILRVYKKRSRVMNTILMSFLGKYDLDKLMQEIIVKSDEIQSLTGEQLAGKFTVKLEV